MKILYDHQIFSSQKYGGISRYFHELMKEFDELDSIECSTSLSLSNNYYLSDKKYVNYRDFLPRIKFRGKIRLFNIFNKIQTIKELNKQDFDIFHPTYYDPYFLEYIGDKPFVLTIHDMIHEKFKDMMSIKDYTSTNKKKLANKANRIIAVSENTKQDIVDMLDIDQNKIDVIYHGNSLIVENTIIDNNILPEKYILFVGSRWTYKNFNRFISGILDILHNDEKLFVVCVGGGKFNDNEIQLFYDLKINERVSQYTLDDNKLPSFYKNALIFVFPSLYEGFGIPILESFACDCPVVCSNASSLPEIADNGAEYFNPYDSESISTAVKNVLNSSERKQILKQNGKDRLKKFSWEKTAEETKKIYESVIQ